MNPKVQKQFKVLGMALLFSLFFISCSTSNREDAATNATNIESGQIAVRTTSEGHEEAVEYFAGIGTITLDESTIVTPQISGIVETVLVNKGDVVEVGDVLYTLTDRDAQNTAAQTLSALRATRDQLKIQYDAATLSLTQMTALHSSGALSDSALKAQQDAVNALTVQYESAKSNYLGEQAILASSLEQYAVESPTAGTVGSINLKKGERVTTQTEVEIIESSSGVFKTSLTATQVKALDDVLTIEVLIDNIRYPASIKSLDAKRNESTMLYDISLTLEDIGELVDGLIGEAHFIYSEQTVITLPTSAIKHIGDNHYAFYEADGVAHRVEVTLGQTGEGWVAVSELAEGKAWIYTGIDQIQDGTPVRVIEGETN